MSRRFVDWAGLIAVVAIALVVRFHSITVPAVWYDEAYSLLLAAESPSTIWSTTARDVHPPLYYVLLHYWMLLFGNGVLSARSLSALADVGTLLLCIKLMSLVATRRATWIAALLLALLPISVRYSQEIRMYTMLGFWLMAATVALVCWVDSPQRKRFAVLYVLLMTAAFYTHYFAALCVLVHWLFWWSARGVRTVLTVRAWIVVNSTIVLLYLPWAPHFIEQLLQRPGLDWILPLTWETALSVVWQFMVMTDLPLALSLWSVVPTGVVLVFAASMLLKKRNTAPGNVLLVAYFFVPVATLVLIALFMPIFFPRYILFCAVGLPLIVAVALDSWWQRQRVLAVVMLAFFLVGEVWGLLRHCEEGNGLEIRMNAIVGSINRDLRVDDEILIDSLYWYLPFIYYNSTDVQPRIYISSTTNLLWGYPDQGGWALISLRPKLITLNDVPVLRNNTKRVWWVTGIAPHEQNRLFPEYWQQTLKLDGGKVEARLFTIDATPTSREADAQPFLTQQPPH